MLPCLQPCLHRTLGLYPLEPVSPNRIPKDGARAFSSEYHGFRTGDAGCAQSGKPILVTTAAGQPREPRPCSVKADANTTASTDAIDKQGGCATGLGHRA